MDRTFVDTREVDHAKLLVALYNNARLSQLGYLNSQDAPKVMTLDMAYEYIAQNGKDFDYVHGRKIKFLIDRDEQVFGPGKTMSHMYNEIYGAGTVERFIEAIKRFEPTPVRVQAPRSATEVLAERAAVTDDPAEREAIISQLKRENRIGGTAFATPAALIKWIKTGSESGEEVFMADKKPENPDSLTAILARQNPDGPTRGCANWTEFLDMMDEKTILSRGGRTS